MDTTYEDALESVVKDNAEFQNIFDTVVRLLKTFICFQSDNEAILLANYVVSTYFYKQFNFSGYIHIYSPEPECGKSTLLDVLKELVFNPLDMTMPTNAIYRIIDSNEGTMMFDEIDKLDVENRPELMGVLNVGFSKRGAKVPKLVGASFTPKWFNVYCPKVICGIGQDAISDALRKRSFPIGLQRATVQEIEMFNLDLPEISEQFEYGVTLQLNQFKDEVDEENNPFWTIEDYVKCIRILRVTNTNSRAIDIGAPLLTIATMGNLDWALDTLNAINEITSKNYIDNDQSWQIELLMLCRTIMREQATDKIFSNDLAVKVNDFLENRFVNWNKGNGINQNQVANGLKRYEIYPKQMRIGTDNKRGYDFNDMLDAFAKYLPEEEPPEYKQEEVELF